MELFRGFASLPPANPWGPGPCVATIGNFDGVHLGHRHLIEGLLARAKALGLPATVMVFEPTAKEFFAGHDAPARLTRFGEKYCLLEQTGIDHLVCLRFSRDLAATSADEFVRRLIVAGMQVKELHVGEDFRFGHRREGDFACLQRAGEVAGFEVRQTDSFVIDGQRVSSSRIRAALGAGDMDTARRLLGREYSVRGRVVEGQRLGRRLGFPTVNIRLRRRVCPVHGIFAVRISGAGLSRWPGVASVGHRPTVSGEEWLLEVYLFDFDGDLYRQRLEIELMHWIREEKHFVDLEAMAVAMTSDAKEARRLLQD